MGRRKPIKNKILRIITYDMHTNRRRNVVTCGYILSSDKRTNMIYTTLHRKLNIEHCMPN